MRLRQRATLLYARGAALSLAVAAVAGVLAALHYSPGLAPRLQRVGLQFAMLRPVHTFFVTAWIFLAGLAVVHRYLDEHGAAETPGERTRLRATAVLWAAAGLGVLVTLPLGITSGREYMEFHPAFAPLILAGWTLFGITFYQSVWRGFWTRPVFVQMWGVAVPFFAWTFVEQHLWMLPVVFRQPIVDLRLQWMATGTLVGSFNLLVYGSLLYVGARLARDEAYACSRMAYALFAVGLVNSFTNFAHHTYHVPQSPTVKWVSFLISMTEVVIVARVAWDLAASAVRRATAPLDLSRQLLVASKWWSLVMLGTAVFISVPPLNSLIHGTQVVTAHAMGTEIGIDTMVLLGALAWVLGEMSAEPAPMRLRWRVVALNVSTAVMVTWLHVAGIAVGVTRYLRLAPPPWVASVGPVVLAASGTAVAASLMAVLFTWLPVLVRRVERAAVPAAAPTLAEK